MVVPLPSALRDTVKLTPCVTTIVSLSVNLCDEDLMGILLSMNYMGYPY